MIVWLLAAALAAAGVVALLIQNAKDYTRGAEEHWPALGRFIDIERVRTHVHEAGDKAAPRILLLHGASANLRELWSPLAPALIDRHHVIAFDRPGYGYSARPRRGAEKLASQARMTARVLEEAGEGPTLIVAHSLGAAVALRVAIDRPDLVKGLVLVAPASHPYPGNNAWWARLAASPVLGDFFCGALIPWLGPSAGRAGVANNFYPSETPQGYYEDAGVGLIFRPAAFRASARDVCATKREFAAQAPMYVDILTPTIIVTGDKDRVVSPQIHARALASELQAVELVIAPDAGHMPHRLRTDLVLAAIARVEAMASPPPEG
ncbi:MAG: alpha/beta hydrolase [Terricaulis sp.]